MLAHVLSALSSAAQPLAPSMAARRFTVSYVVMDIFVPEGARPGDTLGIIFQHHHVENLKGNMMFISVPRNMVAGACFQYRVPHFVGDGWDAPSVLECLVIATRQCVTVSLLRRIEAASYHRRSRRKSVR